MAHGAWLANVSADEAASHGSDSGGGIGVAGIEFEFEDGITGVTEVTEITGIAMKIDEHEIELGFE